MKTEAEARAMLEEQEGRLTGTPWWETEAVLFRNGIIAALYWALGCRSDIHLYEGKEDEDE